MTYVVFLSRDLAEKTLLEHGAVGGKIRKFGIRIGIITAIGAYSELSITGNFT